MKKKNRHIIMHDCFNSILTAFAMACDNAGYKINFYYGDTMYATVPTGRNKTSYRPSVVKKIDTKSFLIS